MIAEIYGKLNSRVIPERSEDELTGNFFGNLRYMSFDRGLKQILKRCAYPAELSGVFDSIDVHEWHNNARFWPREKEAEPDVLLSFDNAVIAIEVKYLSGLSSDDDVDYRTADNALEREESCNQLAREGRLLDRIAGGREKILILLAPDDTARRIYSGVMGRGLLDGCQFIVVTWQSVYDALHEIAAENPYEKAIVDDLICLLRRKGLNSFRSFDPGRAVIDTRLIWRLDSIFAFRAEHVIAGGFYYEFG